MVVTGGLTWWEDFICVACYNLQVIDYSYKRIDMDTDERSKCVSFFGLFCLFCTFSGA